jgi:hypothetical protein
MQTQHGNILMEEIRMKWVGKKFPPHKRADHQNTHLKYFKLMKDK